MKGYILFFLLLLLPNSTSAQINSGTIIVFHVAQDKFIVAADSRAIFNGIPEDTDCKIAVFHNQIVFFTSGADGYRHSEKGFDPVASFDNAGVASDAIHSQPVAKSLDDIADSWANRMIEKFKSLYFSHPDLVIEAGEKGKGTLTTGVFAKAVQGKIILVGRALTYSNDRPGIIMATSLPLDCADRLCASGMTDVFMEYTMFPPKSKRAIDEHILNPTKDETARVVRLVQLSILYTVPKGLVGGEIDTLELWNSGEVHWVKRKDTCPENQPAN